MKQERKPSAISAVTLHRGLCFGQCPAYEVTLRSDGTASWHGHAFVDRMGDHEGKFFPRWFQRLARSIEDSGFFSWEDEYTRDVTDLPTYVLTVVRGSEPKRVLQYATDEPADFWTLATLIDGVAAHVVWDDSNREGPDVM